MWQTKAPVPATRIQNGMEAIKGLKIDPFRSAESQVCCRVNMARIRTPKHPLSSEYGTYKNPQT